MSFPFCCISLFWRLFSPRKYTRKEQSKRDSTCSKRELALWYLNYDYWRKHCKYLHDILSKDLNALGNHSMLMSIHSSHNAKTSQTESIGQLFLTIETYWFGLNIDSDLARNWLFRFLFYLFTSLSFFQWKTWILNFTWIQKRNLQ